MPGTVNKSICLDFPSRRVSRNANWLVRLSVFEPIQHKELQLFLRKGESWNFGLSPPWKQIFKGTCAYNPCTSSGANGCACSSDSMCASNQCSSDGYCRAANSLIKIKKDSSFCSANGEVKCFNRYGRQWTDSKDFSGDFTTREWQDTCSYFAVSLDCSSHRAVTTYP